MSSFLPICPMTLVASMDSTGTWPTHIAQLLFSGLGAASSPLGAGYPLAAGSGHLGFPRFGAARASRPSTTTPSAIPPPARGRPSDAPVEPVPSPLGVGARRQQSSERFNPFRSSLLSQARAAGQGTSSGPRPSSLAAANPFAAFAPPPPIANPYTRRTTTAATAPPPPGTACPYIRRTTTTTSTTSTPHNPFLVEASPWSASASVSVTLGPQGFAGRSSSTATTPTQNFHNPSSNRAVLNTAEEEEEQLLSTLSPSSYIRRLHRELERGDSTPRQDRSGQYQFNTSSQPPSSTSGRAARRNGSSWRHSDPSLLASQVNGGERNRRKRENDSRRVDNLASRNADASAVGRSAETALEIDESDDDDVVEVIDVDNQEREDTRCVEALI